MLVKHVKLKSSIGLRFHLFTRLDPDTDPKRKGPRNRIFRKNRPPLLNQQLKKYCFVMRTRALKLAEWDLINSNTSVLTTSTILSQFQKPGKFGLLKWGYNCLGCHCWCLFAFKCPKTSGNPYYNREILLKKALC